MGIFTDRRIIDLTFPIHEGMTTFPTHWHPFVEITQLGRHGIEDRETRKIVIGTHTGTHVDAPRHFIPNAGSVDEIPLNVLVGQARLADFSTVGAGREITAEDLQMELGTTRHERVVLRFDWHKYWGTLDYYNNHPYLSEDACHWLVRQGCKLLSMDTPMPDNPKNGRGSCKDSPNHKILLGNGCILNEYLCNLDLLKNKDFEIVVMPMKILGADGAPARCMAID